MRIFVGSIVVLALNFGTASAQHTEDPRLAIYRQLLIEANERAAIALGENARLKGQIDKRKQEDEDSAKSRKKN